MEEGQMAGFWGGNRRTMSFAAWGWFFLGMLPTLLVLEGGTGDCADLSADSRACMECHATVTPGIVADWEKSAHARVSPADAAGKGALERRVSFEKLPDKLGASSVGCAECHTLNPDDHKDGIEHQGYRVHPVVSPADCAVCHPVERNQYNENLMAHAYADLTANSLYRDLKESINGVQVMEKGKLTARPSERTTDEDSCLACHGTVVEVAGTVSRSTEMGDMEFPVLTGWPNQGVGRINPDGSKGCCSSCHTRHQFSIETARKPATCSQCHKGPDVPAYKVYSVSKHGNVYASVGKEWNFHNVPWTVGKDFTAPTCAACHMSLVVSPDGQVISQRSHGAADRLPWRIFGLIYSHAHPKSPDTSIIRNAEGLPLPTSLDGKPAAGFLIDAAEQDKRKARMEKLCLSCHSRGWVDGHWARFVDTLRVTDAMTLTATRMVMTAWEKGLAKGLAQKSSVFDEAIEKKWVEQWLFYANSTRFSAAMSGADYGVFADGRWSMSKNVRDMQDWLDSRTGGAGK